jgi:hypothetical protein
VACGHPDNELSVPPKRHRRPACGGYRGQTDGSSYDGNTVYQELTGRREKPSPQFLEAIAKLKESEPEKNDEAHRFPFTMVSLADEIFACADMAREERTFVFFYSKSHAGKTRPAKQYDRIENAKVFGSVVYVRMPTNGYLSTFKMRLASVLGISGRYSTNELHEAIIEWFQQNPDVLLIVDETSECFVGKSPKSARVSTINYIREIHDMAECGVLMIGTEDTGTAFETGPYRNIFKQLTNRGLVTVRHSGELTDEDFDLLAAAVNLPAATGDALKRQETVVAQESVGTWLKLLLRGQKRAVRNNQDFTWDHVIRVDDIRKKLGRKK